MPLSSMKINEKEVPSSLVYNFRTIIMEGVKNGYFMVRLTVRKCETFDPLKGLKTVFFDKKKNTYFLQTNLL